MGTTRWLAACAPEVREGLADAVSRASGESGQLELDFFDSAESLREQARQEPGVRVAVGTLGSDDVSDVNLAAALIHDGYVRQVMLVRERVSGSFMSRARQAGVYLVAEVRAEGTFLYPLMGSSDVGGGLSIREEAGPAVSVAELPTPVPSQRKQHTLEEGRAPVVVVASGRGGVGKTTLVALAGLQARAWGMRVALVDLDLAQGNLRALIGEGRQGVLSVDGTQPPDVGTLIAEAQRGEQGMLVVGPCERPEDADVAAPIVRELLDRLTAEVDLVLVDTSNTVTDAVADAMQAADRLLLVSDDLPGGLASLARVSGLAVRLGVARARIVRIANRYDDREPTDLSLGRAEVGLEMARVHQVYEGGEDVAELAAEGALADVPKECRELGSSVATCLARLLGELGRLPDNPAAQKALEGKRERRLLPFFRRQREAS